MRSNLKKILAWTMLSILGITVMPQVLSSGELPAQAYTQEAAYRLQQQDRDRQLRCLARNVYYEAGTEPYQGQLAVAQVTINRARSGQFPRDLCAVVSQSQWRSGTRICQFSWYCDNTKNRNLHVSNTHPSYLAAKAVLLQGARVAKLGGDAYYFHNTSVTVGNNPYYRRITQIGHHIFYRHEK